MATISLIAAVACGGVIGQGGKIPLHLPNDLKRFKELTTGHAVIMGRKTYDSIVRALGKPLPERENIILTREKEFQAPRCYVVHSWDDAVHKAQCLYGEDTEIFVIGGAEIYALALPYARRFYITEVNGVTAPCNGENVYFPLWHTIVNDSAFPVDWQDIVPQEHHPTDETHKLDYTFRVVERKNDAVYLPNAHDPEQLAAMERITARRHCPFCLENLAREHKKPILWEGPRWIITSNQWPYKNTKRHLLIILRRHLERVEDMTPEEFGELVVHLQRFMAEYVESPGGALCLRFGDPKFSGSTVRHLHAQLVVPDILREGYTPVLFHVGGK